MPEKAEKTGCQDTECSQDAENGPENAEKLLRRGQKMPKMAKTAKLKRWQDWPRRSRKWLRGIKMSKMPKMTKIGKKTPKSYWNDANNGQVGKKCQEDAKIGQKDKKIQEWPRLQKLPWRCRKVKFALAKPLKILPCSCNNSNRQERL